MVSAVRRKYGWHHRLTFSRILRREKPRKNVKQMILMRYNARLLFFLLVVCRATLTQSAEPNEFATNLRRRLVTGGTPTGGGKYPFLAVIRWQHDDDLLVRSA